MSDTPRKKFKIHPADVGFEVFSDQYVESLERENAQLREALKVLHRNVTEDVVSIYWVKDFLVSKEQLLKEPR